MYDLTYGLKRVASHETFEFAFIDLYDRLQEEDDLSYQFLETTIWIEEHGSNNPEFFYDARDKAHQLGILDAKGEITKTFREAYNNKDLPVLRTTTQCPECSSSDIHQVHPFDHVWECNTCRFNFHKGDG